MFSRLSDLKPPAEELPVHINNKEVWLRWNDSVIEAVGDEVNTKPPVLTMTLSSVVIRVLSGKKLNLPITLKDSVAVWVSVKRKAVFREIKKTTSDYLAISRDGMVLSILGYRRVSALMLWQCKTISLQGIKCIPCVTISPCIPIILWAPLAYTDQAVWREGRMPQVARANRVTKFVNLQTQCQEMRKKKYNDKKQYADIAQLYLTETCSTVLHTL